MKTNTYLKWTIVALVVINLISVGAHWFSRGVTGPFGPGGPPPRGQQGFLERQLHFTDAQELEHSKLKEKHHQASRMVLRQIEDEKDAMFDLFGQENASQLAAAHAEKIGQLQAQLEVLTFDHFAAIRGLCTPEQAEKFDEIIKDALRQGPPGGPPHGGPPPPHGRPPHPPRH